MPSHYVQIVEEKCNGCVLCMKACPTKAIRVREDQKARIEGVCIDCGECVRVCPRGAVEVVTTGSDHGKLNRYPIIGPSPVLYTQFGEEFTPNEILLAVRKAFRYVYDQAYTHELFNAATELFIQECREGKREVNWPIISPVCPVVNLLIAYRFPSLLDHILPIVAPREIAARELKRRLYCEGVFNTDEFGIYHVSPCSAKMLSIKEPMFLEASHINGVLGINEVFHAVKRHLGQVDEEVILHHSSGVGIGWGGSGGEIAGLGLGNYLAVSGMQETIRYLEKIEMGLLTDVEYIEFRSCSEGCIGGPLTVADKYQAKRTLEKIVRKFGVEKRVSIKRVQKAYQEGWFASNKVRSPLNDPLKRLSIPDAIERQERIEQLLQRLPRKECALCGSPDCRTFAEDVVDGRASPERCMFLKRSIAGGLKK
ncbi:MAG: 4Fe-4S dicluster domain-containing protein [Deltaproteobacteria bacterium]|nr:4Fe-4S dicluster domain-containing protein [Deltaproteobacteria bacterium]